MITTMQMLVEGAYSRSTANDPGKLATDGEMIGVLNRIYHTLFALAAAAAPEKFLSRAALPALAGAPASAVLSTDVIDIRRVQNAAGGKVNVIPVEEIDRGWHLAPAVYRQGGSLVTRAQVGDPVVGDVLTVLQLDAPADLVALASVVDARFPTRHVELIIVEGAMYLSTKDEGRDTAEFGKLKAYRDAQLEMFIKLSGLSMTALQSPHGGMIIQRIQALMGHTGGSPAAQG
jgi:hypothetical protein